MNRDRQYNNELLIKFIDKNENGASNKIAYAELINFLNYSLEKVIIHFMTMKMNVINLKMILNALNLIHFLKEKQVYLF